MGMHNQPQNQLDLRPHAEWVSDWYGERWQLPRNVRLHGNFTHNRGRFNIAVFESPNALDSYVGKDTARALNHNGPNDYQGNMSAQASVISAHREAPVDIIDVADGDILILPNGRFRIRQPLALHDPYLQKVG